MRYGIVISIILSSAVLLDDAQSEIHLKASAHRTKQYERIEFSIGIDKTFTNPYDPQQADISILLTGPDTQSIRIPAFWCQDFELIATGDNKGGSGFYPLHVGSWKARFAATIPGMYKALVQYNDPIGVVKSNSVDFEITPSADPGYVRVHRMDPRFFQFSNGDFFFPIGQNVAFMGEGQYVNLTKADAIFRAMANHGANFSRVWPCCEDWAMAIEAQKSAYDRSWSRRPNLLVAAPDDPGRKSIRFGGTTNTLTIDPSHPVMLRPNTEYRLTARLRSDKATPVQIRFGREEKTLMLEPPSEWISLDYRFTTGAQDRWLGRITMTSKDTAVVWLDGISLTETAGGPELLWEADANRPARGVYNQLDCFMLDEVVRSAEQRGIYLMLCLITRNAYMDDLKNENGDAYQTAVNDAKNLLRYAVARWGYSTHVAAWEYFNEIDPGLPTDRFYTELARYLDEIDIYRHLRTTSTWHPSARDCKLSALDIAQLHHYMRPTDKNGFGDQFKVLIEKSNWLRQYAPSKPALIGEFGLADDKWGLSEYLKQDSDCFHFKTSLWAAAFAGSSGTTLFWWWDQLDRQNVYPHYKSLAEYMRGVSFAQMKTTTAHVSDANCGILGYQSDLAAYLWIYDRTATWFRRIVEKQSPKSIINARLSIPDLSTGNYSIEWWDTRTGKIIRQEDAKQLQDILIPEFSSDIACKIQSRKSPN